MNSLNSAASVSNFDVLPPELKLEIFSYLPGHQENALLRRVCQQWKALADDSSFWNSKAKCLGYQCSDGSHAREKVREKVIKLQTTLNKADLLFKNEKEFINKLEESKKSNNGLTSEVRCEGYERHEKYTKAFHASLLLNQLGCISLQAAHIYASILSSITYGSALPGYNDKSVPLALVCERIWTYGDESGYLNLLKEYLKREQPLEAEEILQHVKSDFIGECYSHLIDYFLNKKDFSKVLELITKMPLQSFQYAIFKVSLKKVSFRICHKIFVLLIDEKNYSLCEPIILLLPKDEQARYFYEFAMILAKNKQIQFAKEVVNKYQTLIEEKIFELGLREYLVKLYMHLDQKEQARGLIFQAEKNSDERLRCWLAFQNELISKEEKAAVQKEYCRRISPKQLIKTVFTNFFQDFRDICLRGFILNYFFI